MKNVILPTPTLNIQSNFIITNDIFLHKFTFKLNNSTENDILDVSVYLFTNENIISPFSKCIIVYPMIHATEYEIFEYDYYCNSKNIQLNFRIIYRIKGQNTHRYFDVDYSTSPLLASNTNSFVSLIKIKGLKRIIDVTPITNGICFSKFGAIIDTYVSISYLNYTDDMLNAEFCKSTLIKGLSSVTLSSIKYGKFSYMSFGN